MSIETAARHCLRRAMTGRRLILIGGSVSSLTSLARQLTGVGALPPFLLASNRGDGSCSEFDAYSLDVCELDIATAMQAYEQRLADLPAPARRAIDRYDPRGDAEALGLIVLSQLPEVAGRPRYGARPTSWIALEDKTRVDGFWDRAGIRRVPSTTVPCRDATWSVAQQLDGGAGTVWAGDARAGVHGGGSRTRCVRTAQDARRTASWMGEHCDAVRVMPFLQGRPCSIHGIVMGDGIAVFRPVELLCLIRPATGEFVYAGTSTYWDPARAHRDQMRAVAARTGAALVREVGYRGPFVVDGVLTDQGFLPTEINTRLGMGLVDLGKSCPALDLPLSSIVVQAGDCHTSDMTAADLERHVVGAADAQRHCTIHTAVYQHVERAVEVRLHHTPEGVTRASGNGNAHLRLEPSLVGGFLSFTPDAEQLAVGDSLAKLTVQAFAAADAHLGTRLGSLCTTDDISP